MEREAEGTRGEEEKVPEKLIGKVRRNQGSA